VILPQPPVTHHPGRVPVDSTGTPLVVPAAAGQDPGMTPRYGDHPGVAVAVRDRAGYRLDGPVHEPVPVFSLTKMFLATAALRLAERGLLALDRPVGDLAPGVPPGATPRALLRHTAGVADYATDPGYLAAVADRPARPWPLAAILAAAGRGPAPVPGVFRYANTGYWILGEVLARAAGVPLPGLLAAAVFAPAGMTGTRYPGPGTGTGGTPGGYDTGWAGPAGAAWSTPVDLLRFLDALLSGALVSAASLAAMRVPVPVPAAGPPWRDPGYGLGLMLDGDLGTVGHGGGGPGYRAAAFAVPARGARAAVLAPDGAGVDPTGVVLDLLGVPARGD